MVRILYDMQGKLGIQKYAESKGLGRTTPIFEPDTHLYCRTRGFLMTRPDGGPAFPVIQPDMIGVAGGPGMSLRDWFAGMALHGLMAGNWPVLAESPPELWAKTAYLYANAMLTAREGT